VDRLESEHATSTAGTKGRTLKVKEVEELITSINGVTACRIVINDWGAVEEVHVLATAERAAKGIARDVESALHARFGMDVDHKKISVAQVGTPPPTAPAEYRLQIKGHRIEVDQQNHLSSVEVELLTPIGTVVTGRASGPTERRTLMRIAGQATVTALATLLASGPQLSLDELTQIHAGGREIVMAVLSFEGEHAGDVLVGTSALLPGEEVSCAVRACLDGVNRRLSFIMGQP